MVFFQFLDIFCPVKNLLGILGLNIQKKPDTLFYLLCASIIVCYMLYMIIIEHYLML